MSWKSVEMQVALPRVQDAGKIQEQLQQRGQLLQDTISNNQLLTEELKRKKVNDYNQKDNVNNKKKEDSNKQYREGHEHSEESENTSDHPFLGKQIDFNG
ncbi:hypothetical protein GH741_06280 [Aquibacillus halophilus]|uniref:RNA polymerase subunit sigma n=1 Tax=Aquibacillus halophilus TaxID=930132 RepID=A0A6A8DCM6_9BACI|nr:hypothetical protein [Aquibacillus halophilus]MRH42286.1 hypothetical protein [Aquibacillus halophilus]